MGHVDNSQITPLTSNTVPGNTANAVVFPPAMAAFETAINENYDEFQAFKAALELPIPDQSIVTRHLRNLAVTNPKLAPLAVTADKIADGTITTAKLADLVITAAKIASNAILERHMSNSSVSRRTIVAGAVGANEIDPTILNPISDAALNVRLNQIDEQLADTVRISQFPRLAGETDDTDLLQRAFNYAKNENKELINHDASLMFEVSRPLYVESSTRINLGGAIIKKTTNTKGEGSNVIRSGTVTDSYVVDAFIILRHEDEQHTMFVKIKGIQFQTSASVRHQYGIYAPRLARSKLEDIRTGYGVADYCAFGYQWWLIHTFKNIRLDGGILTWAIDNDGSNIGQSTSIYAEQIVGTNQEGCFRLYGVSYSQINNPMVDNANGLAYRFTSCRGITVTSASVEYLNSGRFILVEDANVVLNTPNVIMITGGHASDTYLIQARDSGKLQINEGKFSDYTTSTNTKNFPLMVTNNSPVTLIDTELPTNGNGYRGLTNNGVVIEFNKNGLVFNQLNGSNTIYQNDTRTKVGYGSSLPTDGTWNKGDIFRITAETFGKPIEYVCITSGTPGTWTWTKCATRMGGTSSRTPGLTIADRGVMYLDTTLNAGGLPIWWNGTTWIKHDGNPA